MYLSSVHKGLRSLQTVLLLNCRGNTPQHSSGGSSEAQTETWLAAELVKELKFKSCCIFFGIWLTIHQVWLEQFWTKLKWPFLCVFKGTWTAALVLVYIFILVKPQWIWWRILNISLIFLCFFSPLNFYVSKSPTTDKHWKIV